MQAELPPAGAPLNGGATHDALNPGVALPATAVSLDPGDHPLPSPPSAGSARAAKKVVLDAVPPIDIVNLLTGTSPNPEATKPLSAQDAAILNELEVGAKIIQSLTKRGNLALDACRLHATHKAATGEDIFPQERFDAYMDLVDQIISPEDGAFNVIIPADPFLGCRRAAPPEDATAESSASEDEDEGDEGDGSEGDGGDDNMDEHQQA